MLLSVRLLIEVGAVGGLEDELRRRSEAADTLPPPHRTRKELEEYNKGTLPSGKKSKHTDDEGDQMIRRCGGEPLSEK